MNSQFTESSPSLFRLRHNFVNFLRNFAENFSFLFALNKISHCLYSEHQSRRALGGGVRSYET